jgi:hypothetical protein
VKRLPSWLPGALAILLPFGGAVAFAVRAESTASEARTETHRLRGHVETLREDQKVLGALMSRVEVALRENEATLTAVRIELARYQGGRPR